MGNGCSGAKEDLMLEDKGCEIVCAVYCCRKAYTSAKHNVKLHPTLREYTAEKSDFMTLAPDPRPINNWTHLE